MGRNKKGFLDKTRNKEAIFIALMVALIVYVVDTMVWSIETTIEQFNVSFEAHGIARIISVFFLLVFIKYFYNGID